MAHYMKFIPHDCECFVALEANSKKPRFSNWQNEGRSFNAIDPSGANVGLILGAKSGILDVDIDCREAKELADTVLPKPSATFDRGSEDSGHYLYEAEATGPRKSFVSNNNSTLVELRGDGSQTMIPPSIHPNGVPLSFTAVNDDAEAVHYDELLRAVNLLAACAEVAQNWREGRRHDLALAFSGLARKHRLEPNLVMQIVQRICQIIDDLELEDRLNAVRTTFGRSIEIVIGFSGLVECLGEATAKRIADRLEAYSGITNQITDLVTTQPKIEGVVSYGQFSDKANVTEAKMGTVFAEWLDGKAVYAFEKNNG